MPSDLGTLLREAARPPRHDLDLDAIASTARSRTRRRRLGTAAGLASVVALVALASNLTTDDGRSVAATPSTTVAAERGVVVYPQQVLDDVVLLGAPVGFEATGSLLSIDLANGDVRHRNHDVPLWPGDFPHPMLVVGDRLLWADLSHAWSMPVDLGDDPVRIGEASFLFPSARRDRVWLVEQSPMRATEVDARGAVTTPEWPLPNDAWPVAATDGGLVVSSNDVQVLAAAGDRWYLGNGQLLDRSDGAVAQLPIDGVGAEVAAFSPDGRHLAVFTGPPGTRTAGINLFLDGATTPRFHRLQSIEAPSFGQLAWSADGEALYLLAHPRPGGDGSMRVIGIPIDGAPETVATIDDPGWSWLAVR